MINRTFLGLHLASSTDSFDASRVTWLAIVEFIIASLIGIWIAWDGTYLLYLLLGALTTILFLLRTQKSVLLGLELMNSWLDFVVWVTGQPAGGPLGEILKAPWSIRWAAIRFIAMGLISVPCTPLAAILIRMTATTVGCISDPREAISQIPKNWFRQVFCLDMRHPPELVPGIERQVHARWPGMLFQFSSGLRHSRGMYASRVLNVADTASFFGTSVVIYGPTMVYRNWFKIVSLVWLPLLWCVGPFSTMSITADQRLNDIRFGVVTRLALAWSTVVIIGFVTKLHIAATWNWVSPSVIEHELIVETYPWHVIAFLSGAMTWLMFVGADIGCRKARFGNPWPESATLDTLNALVLFRRVFAVYTLVNALWLVVVEAKLLTHVRFGWKWFSWMT